MALLDDIEKHDLDIKHRISQLEQASKILHRGVEHDVEYLGQSWLTPFLFIMIIVLVIGTVTMFKLKEFGRKGALI